MMDKKRGFLQLVWDSVAGNNLRKDSSAIQMDLFTHSDEHSVLIVYFSDIDSESFSKVIKNTQPSYIVDMRANPRFDIAGYSRKIAFTEFESIGAIYIDCVELSKGVEKNKNELVHAVESGVFKKMKRGPLVFIMGKKEQDAVYEEELLHKLPKTNSEWNLSIIP